MAVSYVLGLFLLSLAMSTVVCQTFQYSHGWTNGKRSQSPSLEEIVHSASKNGKSDSVLVNCELQKLKLLLEGNVNSQLLQVPCELFNSPKRNFVETISNQEQFRRDPTSSNNY